MGQILGLGITHYPNLASKLNMSWRFQKALEDRNIAPTSAESEYIAQTPIELPEEKANEVLESIRTHVEPASWQASVAMFLEGKLTADALLAKASPDPLLTEAHAYIGIKAHLDGDVETAKKHLEWVRDKGRHEYTEYRLALGELDRINRTAADRR